MRYFFRFSPKFITITAFVTFTCFITNIYDFTMSATNQFGTVLFIISRFIVYAVFAKLMIKANTFAFFLHFLYNLQKPPLHQCKDSFIFQYLSVNMTSTFIFSHDIATHFLFLLHYETTVQYHILVVLYQNIF